MSQVKVALLGIPTDVNSSFARGTALAPAKIRSVLFSDAGNAATECGGELGSEIDLLDLGDLDLREEPGDAELITAEIAAVTRAGRLPIALGGDHSITFPIMRALAATHGAMQILHVDAHPDLYHDFGGNPASHASPFARILENRLASRLVQIGIRTLNRHQRAQAARFGVEIVCMRDFDPHAVPVLEEPFYVSIDLDGFDPAFAPGVSHQEPGGLTTRQVLDVLQAQTAPLAGADIVELNPHRDVQGMTAALAAKLVKELAGVAARNSGTLAQPLIEFT